jgi:RNA polymerase sigma-70 factor (ECF subfamily)
MTPQAPGKPQLAELTDEELLARYQRGMADAFTVLIDRYRQELFNFLVRFLNSRSAAEDVFQEAFIQVHLSSDSFDTDRRFKPWLFTIAANKARDFMRKRSRRATVDLDAPVGGPGSSDGSLFIDLLQSNDEMPDEPLERAELQQRVQRIIQQMPEHLREILLLSYFQQFSYNEIADVLQIPLGTVKSRLHTAVATFAKAWKKANPTADDA